jgi:hypothetical protein
MAKLTPIEMMKLQELVDKAAKAVAASEPQSAEALERERVLVERRNKLAAEEKAAADKLGRLRSSLDRVTAELNARIRAKRSDGFPCGAARRYLDLLVANARAALPDTPRPERLVEAVRILLTADFPELAANGYDAAVEEQQSRKRRARLLHDVSEKDETHD